MSLSESPVAGEGPLSPHPQVPPNRFLSTGPLPPKNAATGREHAQTGSRRGWPRLDTAIDLCPGFARISEPREIRGSRAVSRHGCSDRVAGVRPWREVSPNAALGRNGPTKGPPCG